MIKYILGTDLWLYPDLAKSMFLDRAKQFSERLKWDVDVDQKGHERDEYDALNPIYVTVENDLGHHEGSMRLLPTTGRTMINEHFSEALKGGPIRDPAIWECTRFCLSPSTGPQTAAKLFASAGRLMDEYKIAAFVAVFDCTMLRRYRVSCVMPEVLGKACINGNSVVSGQWSFSQTQLNELMRRGSLDPLDCELALANSSLFRRKEQMVA